MRQRNDVARRWIVDDELADSVSVTVTEKACPPELVVRCWYGYGWVIDDDRRAACPGQDADPLIFLNDEVVSSIEIDVSNPTREACARMVDRVEDGTSGTAVDFEGRVLRTDEKVGVAIAINVAATLTEALAEHG